MCRNRRNRFKRCRLKSKLTLFTDHLHGRCIVIHTWSLDATCKQRRLLNVLLFTEAFAFIASRRQSDKTFKDRTLTGVRRFTRDYIWLDPQAEIFHVYGWLVKIYGCFSARPENSGEASLWLNILAVHQIYSCFSAKPENRDWQRNFGPENIVRENVWNTAKKRKKSRFWILKSIKSNFVVLHAITKVIWRAYFNQQWTILT